MADPKYTIFIRVPIPRRGFVDPPAINWDTAKDEALWKIISGATQTEIDWNHLADRFEVPVDFLSQQTHYLTERHAAKVRDQLRKATAAVKGSATASPIPGADSAGIGNLRTPSSLSIRRDSPMPRIDTGIVGSIAQPSSRPTISRNTSANTAVPRDAAPPSPRVPNKPLIRTNEPAARTRLASLPTASPVTRSPRVPLYDDPEGTASPGPAEMSSTTSSDDESSPAQSRIIRRPPRFPPQEPYSGFRDDEDDESEPAFVPYKAPSTGTSSHDLASTLRGDAQSGQRRSAKALGKQPLHHSQTSDSSTGSHAMVGRPGPFREKKSSGVMSPRRTAELAQSSSNASDGKYSESSSFSDLDDASVTRSAMEEAMASNMNRGRLSMLGQAFRGRYGDSK